MSKRKRCLCNTSRLTEHKNLWRGPLYTPVHVVPYSIPAFRVRHETDTRLLSLCHRLCEDLAGWAAPDVLWLLDVPKVFRTRRLLVRDGIHDMIGGADRTMLSADPQTLSEHYLVQPGRYRFLRKLHHIFNMKDQNFTTSRGY